MLGEAEGQYSAAGLITRIWAIVGGLTIALGALKGAAARLPCWGCKKTQNQPST